MTKTIGLAVVLFLFPVICLAQSNQDPLEACYQGPDGAVRLACFNREMQRRHAAAAPATRAPQGPPPAPAEDNVGLHGAELRKKLKEEGVAQGPVKPIVATIVHLLPRSYGEYAFELDNGQLWEQAEAMANLNVQAHDSVTIKPGLLGSFFLTTQRSQRVRVRRIR